MKRSIRERFDDKVDRSAGPKACHPWTAATFKDRGGRPRGKMRVGHRIVTAARVALALKLGAETDDDVLALPSSIDAAHDCDNGLCANEAHIKAQSHADNVRDYCAKYGSMRGRKPELQEAA